MSERDILVTVSTDAPAVQRSAAACLLLGSLCLHPGRLPEDHRAELIRCLRATIIFLESRQRTKAEKD